MKSHLFRNLFFVNVAVLAFILWSWSENLCPSYGTSIFTMSTYCWSGVFYGIMALAFLVLSLNTFLLWYGEEFEVEEFKVRRHKK
jgi:hypothetical protein